MDRQEDKARRWHNHGNTQCGRRDPDDRVCTVVRQRDLLRSGKDLIARRQASLAAAGTGGYAVVNLDRVGALGHEWIGQRHREGHRLTRRSGEEHVVVELTRVAGIEFVARRTRREDQPETIVRATRCWKQRATHRVGDEGRLAAGGD